MPYIDNKTYQGETFDLLGAIIGGLLSTNVVLLLSLRKKKKMNINDVKGDVITALVVGSIIGGLITPVLLKLPRG